MNFAKQRVALSTGVELDVFTAGDPSNPAIIFLHGFPESHRTWRYQMEYFSDKYFCVAPDQRGYCGSGKPEDAAEYTAEKIAADLFALADAYKIESFNLVGHDWGGAIVWLAALQQPKRVERLIVCNGPHPLIFQRSLFDDLEQRAGSQYIRVFRTGAILQNVKEHGLEWFYENCLMKHLKPEQINAEEKAAYLADWSQSGAMEAMLKWYSGSPVVVPPMDESEGEMPERPDFLDGPFPSVTMPTLIVWGAQDKALLPCQLEGLDDLVDDVTITKVDAGHFVIWEAPDAVNAAIANWLP